MRGVIRGVNVGRVQGCVQGGPSSCNQYQLPIPEEHTPAESEKPGLPEFCEAWNTWHDAGIVSQRIRNAQTPGKTITDAWRRAQRVPEQRDRLGDLPAIQDAIQSSQEMLLPAPWFDAAGLLAGKNSNHRYYAEMLLKGQYRDRSTNPTGDYRDRVQSEKTLAKELAKEKRTSDAFDIVLSAATNCSSGDC